MLHLMLNRLRKVALWALGVLFFVYLAVCVFMRVRFRALCFDLPAHATPTPPAGASMLALRAEDGVVVHALEIPPPDDRAHVVVVFHGNGESIGDWCDIAEAFRAKGLGVVITEYRGFGASGAAGEPSEQGLYRDAAAVLDAVAAQGVARERVVIVGQSLGTGVAAEMARRGKGGALVLISPYTSFVDLARIDLPYLPWSVLATERFDTLSKAGEIRMPALVVHGDADEMIPFAMGRAVAAAIPGAKLHVVGGGHHNDLWHLWLWRWELVEAIASVHG
jgi:pimeloyl-ACP methyl ester carboxylesterase